MNAIPNLPTAASPATTAVPMATLRVVAGDVAAVPVGELLKAVVAKVAGGQAEVNVGGQTVTVRPPAGLQPGNEIVVRVPIPPASQPPSTAPTLELLGRAPPSEGAPTATATKPAVVQSTPPAVLPQQPAAAPKVPERPEPPAKWPDLKIADVVTRTPDGRVQVRIDGKPLVATPSEPLVPGGRYVVRVETTATGTILRPPLTDAPETPVAVATALLRTALPPDLGATAKPLLAELAAPVPAPTPAVRASVQSAAGEVREAVRSFLPDTPRPLMAVELRSLVENGGPHFEAKLARSVAVGTEVEPTPNALPATRPADGDAPTPDLKGGLLKLLSAAQSLGEAATAYPVARTVLDGIESQQAVHTLAQQTGTPYFLQIPFPDGDHWRTAQLSLEPDRSPDGETASSPRGFRVMMHVPMRELGDAWIDAGLGGGRFRAVVYLDSPAARDLARAEMTGLHDELRAGGFADVSLEVRAVGELTGPQRERAAAVRAGRPLSATVLDARA